MFNVTRRGLALVAAFAMLAGSGMAAADDLDKVRLMKVVPHPYAFLVVDVGYRAGIFEKHGIDLEISGSAGDAKLMQAMSAGAADIGLSSGIALGFALKGAPVIGFLASHGAPLNMGIVVTPESPLYAEGMTIDDLEGKKIGVSSPSSLTYFLSRRMAVERGWGADGVETVALGGFPAQIAASKAGNIDAFVMSVDAGYALEAKGSGRVFVSFGDYIKDFHTHLFMVTDKFREKNPEVLRRFSAAYLESTEYALANKDAMVQAAMEILEMPEEVASKSFDTESPAFSTTGRFDPAALELIAEGLVETGIVEDLPDLSRTYTEEYLPAVTN